MGNVENTAATGKPAISGTPAVGETLTAGTAAIEDVNGLTNAEFAFQWTRYDGTTRTDITGATSDTYTVQNEDVGQQVSVTVSFTDDDGFQESLNSDSVLVGAPSSLFGGFDTDTVPEEHNGQDPFTFEIYFSEEPSLGYANVRDHVLTVTNGDVTSASRTTPGENIRWTITVQPDGNDDVAVVLPPTTDCSDDGAVCTASEKALSNRSSITVPGPATQSQQQQAQNSPAAGRPTISGTARVGETLTADTSGITDADGLDNATFSYQWLADDADISGSTGSTYTLATADEGRAITVRVSFTDDGGNDETLTSAPTEAVAARTDSIDGQHSRCAGEPRWSERRHLRAAVQRGG